MGEIQEVTAYSCPMVAVLQIFVKNLFSDNNVRPGRSEAIEKRCEGEKVSEDEKV